MLFGWLLNLKMKFMKIVLSLFVTMVSVGAIAQQGLIVVPIPGACGAFVDAISRKNETQAVIDLSMVTGWMWGYMSRYNIDNVKNPISIPSQTATLDLYVEKYCRANPLKYLNDATEQLIVDLGGVAKPKK